MKNRKRWIFFWRSEVLIATCSVIMYFLLRNRPFGEMQLPFVLPPPNFAFYGFFLPFAAASVIYMTMLHTLDKMKEQTFTKGKHQHPHRKKIGLMMKIWRYIARKTSSSSSDYFRAQGGRPGV